MYPKKQLYNNSCYGHNMTLPTSRPQYDGRQKSHTMSFSSGNDDDAYCNLLRHEHKKTSLTRSNEISHIMNNERRMRLFQAAASFRSMDESCDNSTHRDDMKSSTQTRHNHKGRKPRSRTMSFLSTDDASDNSSLHGDYESNSSIKRRDDLSHYYLMNTNNSSGRTLTTQASSFRSKSDDDSYNTTSDLILRQEKEPPIETHQQQQRQGKKLRSHTMSFLPQDDSYDNLLRQEFRSSYPKQINNKSSSSHFMLKRKGSSCHTSMVNGSINDSDDNDNNDRHQTSSPMPTSRNRTLRRRRSSLLKSSSSHTMLCQLNDVNLDCDDDDDTTIAMEDIDLSLSLVNYNNLSTPTELLKREIEQLKSDLIEAKAALEIISTLGRQLKDDNDQLKKMYDDALISNRNALIIIQEASIEIYETRAHLKKSYKDLVMLSWNVKKEARMTNSKYCCLLVRGYVGVVSAVKNMLNNAATTTWRPSFLFSILLRSARDDGRGRTTTTTSQKRNYNENNTSSTNAQSMSTRLLKSMQTEICDINNTVITDDDYDYHHQQQRLAECHHDVEMMEDYYYLQKFSSRRTSSRWDSAEVVGTVTKRKTDGLIMPSSFDEGFQRDTHGGFSTTATTLPSF